MTVKLPDVSEFQSPASGNAPNWAGIKSQNGGAAIIRTRSENVIKPTRSSGRSAPTV